MSQRTAKNSQGIYQHARLILASAKKLLEIITPRQGTTGIPGSDGDLNGETLFLNDLPEEVSSEVIAPHIALGTICRINVRR